MKNNFSGEIVSTAAVSLGGRTNFITLFAVATAIGGLLFGFDNLGIAYALPFLLEQYKMNPAETGWVVSSVIVGCMIGVLIGGRLSDSIGRKKVLLLAGLLFLISSIWEASTTSATMLSYARICVGLGIGMETTVVPLYIAEVSPPKLRGRLVSLNQLFNVIGAMGVFGLGMIISSTHTHAWNVENAWRFIFISGVVPAVIFLVMLLIIPESPRWLCKQGRKEESMRILEKIHGTNVAQTEMKEIVQSLQGQTATFSDLWKKGLRYALIVAVLMALFQQITGINAVYYYGPEIFQSAGFGSNTAILNTFLFNGVNLVFTIIGVWLVDKVGRKTLALIGTSIMTISLAVIGAAFQMTPVNGMLVLTFILLYIASFGVSLGVVTWVIISEIFPTKIRGLASSIATFALWGGNFVVSQFFPILVHSAGTSRTFYVFALLSLIAFIFTLKFVPETKNKSLEEIEMLWARS